MPVTPPPSLSLRLRQNNRPYGYRGLKIFTSLKLRFQDFQRWIRTQIDSGKYGNDSEYLRELIRLDQEHKNKIAMLRLALIEGEKSGITDRSMADILNDAKERHNISV